MELTRMKLADLRPNPANIRTAADEDDIEELADLLELTPGAPGEPIVPLIAMRDANVGRIVDGHRRYHAMTARGKVDSCNVLLCDTAEDRERAEKVIMLLAATGKQVDGDDFTRGLQESMLLGVPESDVDKLARKKGAGRALRRAIERNGGQARQMSLDRVLAAEEVLETGGTQDDYDEVMNADDDFGWTKDRIIRKIASDRKRAEVEDAIAEVVAAHGLVVADKKPKGALLRKSLWDMDAETVRAEGPTWAASRAVLVRPKQSYRSWELYDEPKEMPEEEQRAVKTRNDLRRVRTAGEKKRAAWVYDRLCQGGGGMRGLNALQVIVEHAYDGGQFDLDAAYFLKRAGVAEGDNALPLAANAWMCAFKWDFIDHVDNDACDAICTGELRGDWVVRAAERHVALMRALVSDGYEPDEDESAFTSLCNRRLAEARKKAQ